MRENKSYNMFNIESDFTIKEITKDSFIYNEEYLKILFELIRKHETMYPNIDKWFTQKVIPGLKTGQRKAYIGFLKSEPIVSSILKLGKNSKFCHLNIDTKYQHLDIGDIFFSIMTLDAQRVAKEIHFTLPESLWMNKRNFFESFGFSKTEKSTNQYRNFEKELKCTAKFDNVLKKVINKIPVLKNQFTLYHDDIQNGVLLSIHPKYIQKIYTGEKTVEIRNSFSFKHIGRRVSLYSTYPLQSIHGSAIIERIEKDTPEEIWSKFKEQIGCSKEEFFDYTQNKKETFSIKLKDFDSFPAPIPLSQLRYLLKEEIRPPQSYYIINQNESWSKAITISEFLNKRFKVHLSII